jgi:hypothetical protein
MNLMQELQEGIHFFYQNFISGVSHIDVIDQYKECLQGEMFLRKVARH